MNYLPQAIEAEQAVLGGIMLAGRPALDEVADILTPESFYRADHQLIYRAIVALAPRNKRFDPVTLGDWLERKGYREDAPTNYLVDLASTVPSAANVRAYAGIVADKALLRRAIDVGAQISAQGFEPQGRSGIEVIGQAQTLVAGLLAAQPCEVRAMSDVMTDVFAELVDFKEQGGGLDGQPTGFGELDDLLRGMVPGLYVIAGRPKMGKSTLAQNIAEHLAIRKKRACLIFSIEMTEKQFAKRILSSSGDVDSARVRDGRLDDVDWHAVSRAVREVKGSPLFVVKPDRPRVENLCAQARKQHAKTPLGAIVVDYLQLMEFELARGENESTAYGRITGTLAKLGRELGIVVILLSQLNRDVESRTDKRPKASDLRSSGAIEQDADAVLFVYRDEEYHADSRWKGTAEIILGLHRHGPPGMVRLLYRGDRYRFEDLPFGWEPEPLPKKAKAEKTAFGGKDKAAGQ